MAVDWNALREQAQQAVELVPSHFRGKAEVLDVKIIQHVVAGEVGIRVHIANDIDDGMFTPKILGEVPVEVVVGNKK